ncbi:MAG: ABC transporter ATP-binding protein [Candidatus Limiplasma sp.]|nr:ABC transporter ATP-binding protein [Candidatus Limiplasma sp.]
MLTTAQKVLRQASAYRGLLILSLLLAAATVALTLYVPILIGQAIDRIVGAGQVDFSGLAQTLVTIGVCVAATGLLQWVLGAVNNRMTYHIVRDVRREAFARIQRLPLSYLDQNPTGDLVSRIIADVDQFADGLLMGFTQLFTGVTTILATLTFMFVLRWQIALVVLCVTPLSLLLARFVGMRTFHMFREQSRTRGEQTALVDELIGQQKVVQAFGQEPQMLAKFDEVNQRLADATLRATFYSSITFPSTRFINAIVYAGVALGGALSAVGTGGLFTVGQLATFLSYVTQYTRPFSEITGVVTELQNAMACAARIFALIEEPLETPDAPAAGALTDVRGDVDVTNLAFSYTAARPFIQDFSLTARQGQRIAIVGPTGCGKTTIINLLMRFFDVDAGAIQIDGQDIRTVTRRSLRAGFGMVLQDSWLKTATVRENLLMGNPRATEQEMIAAAKASHAHSFIKRLPQGYDTLIGEEGGGLSQGQKQLLCIARVMLSQPPMLILDEATSSIDTRTEMKIQDAFLKLMEGRTSFIVAHRLSTIRSADVIVVMKDGRIIEQGDHDSLLKLGGFYATLYNSQFAA